jgi:ABC-type branched-subunit amino acid transport system substrate-binding protein
MNAMASQLGYQVVLDDFLPTSPTRDYQTEALKVMQSKADTIFTATDDPADALTLVKDLYNLGFKGTRITFVDTDDTFLAQFDPSANGTFAPGIAPSDFSQVFTAAYQSKYNTAPDYTAALGYDFIRSIVGALQANDWSLTGVASSVIAYQYPNPAISGFQFLPDRTVNYTMELWEAQNGHYAKAVGY